MCTESGRQERAQRVPGTASTPGALVSGAAWGQMVEDNPREAVGGQVDTHRGPTSFRW